MIKIATLTFFIAVLAANAQSVDELQISPALEFALRLGSEDPVPAVPKTYRDLLTLLEAPFGGRVTTERDFVRAAGPRYVAAIMRDETTLSEQDDSVRVCHNDTTWEPILKSAAYLRPLNGAERYARILDDFEVWDRYLMLYSQIPGITKDLDGYINSLNLVSEEVVPLGERGYTLTVLRGKDDLSPFYVAIYRSYGKFFLRTWGGIFSQEKIKYSVRKDFNVVEILTYDEVVSSVFYGTAKSIFDVGEGTGCHDK